VSGAFLLRFSLWSLLKQQAGGDEDEKEHRDDTVQRKKGCVHSPQVIRRDDQMLIE
jgi:hypothetical protein